MSLYSVLCASTTFSLLWCPKNTFSYSLLPENQRCATIVVVEAKQYCFVCPVFLSELPFAFVVSPIPRRNVLIGVPLDLSTQTGMRCVGTYGENCKSDNVSKYRVCF